MTDIFQCSIFKLPNESINHIKIIFSDCYHIFNISYYLKIMEKSYNNLNFRRRGPKLRKSATLHTENTLKLNKYAFYPQIQPRNTGFIM